MKIFVLSDLESDWYPKNAIFAFKKFSTFEFVDHASEADIIWFFSYYVNGWDILKGNILSKFFFRKTVRNRKEVLKDKLIISSFHHLDRDKEKSYIHRVRQADRLSDVIHFFSESNVSENRDYFDSPILCLPYWIDPGFMKDFPTGHKESFRRLLGIPENKILIGSFQRDTETDLRTPKLSKGPDTFCDIVETLHPDRYFVLLAGPRRNYIEDRLTKRGIGFESLGKVSYDQMRDLYGSLDVYLVTSRCEGGPQAILEAMATKTPIYSTPVGISNILSDQVVFSESFQFVNALEKTYPDVLDTHYESVKQFRSSRIIKIYERVFGDLVRQFRESGKIVSSHYVS
jgi:glycosyltransferase involved in cell wall biosynthesis|tara:strand:+ start:273 stop:1304 length:1032 start_codon:yes stop_codon:yes gene_type:complete